MTIGADRKHSAPICAKRARPYLLTAAILASALGYIDGTIVAIALPTMRESLGASLVSAQWISNAYVLALAALTLLGGSLADRLGLVRVFSTGIAVFVAASLLCALATGPGFLIAMRGLQGVGAALMVPGSLALISASYPPEERGAAIGTWAAASAITTAIGPALGGVLITFGGPEIWRLIFAVNLPLGAIALFLLWRYAERETARNRIPLDIPGAMLATLGLGALAFALTGAEHGGEAPRWAGLFALVGCVAIAAFIATEMRSPHPMMPLRLFARPVFAAANMLTFTLYFALSAVLFFLPMAVIGGWGLSELAVSLGFLPLTLCISLMSRPVGKWADRVGPGRPLIIGSLCVAAGYAVLAATTPYQSFWVLTIPSMTVAALGMGFVVAPLSSAVIGEVQKEESGLASGINNAVARIGGLVAVAALGGVAVQVYASAGGELGFGQISGDGSSLNHASASSRALATIAWVTSLLAGLSAAVAWFVIGWRRRDAASPS